MQEYYKDMKGYSKSKIIQAENLAELFISREIVIEQRPFKVLSP